MESKTDNFVEKARSYAFLLLKFRLRSEKELAQRLEKKEFDPETIKATISFLKDKRFIDDELFAKSWIISRLKKPYGFNRIKQELKLKGIAPGIINRQYEALQGDYGEPDLVLKLAKERFAKLKGVEPQKARQRIYGWLIRRGFSSSAVIEALGQL